MLNEKKAEELTKKITDLGDIFKGRISDLSLYGVLDYVNHNEFELAFDIMLDGLVENDIKVVCDEYRMLSDIATKLGKCGVNGLAHLKKKLMV